MLREHQKKMGRMPHCSLEAARRWSGRLALLFPMSMQVGLNLFYGNFHWLSH